MSNPNRRRPVGRSTQRPTVGTMVAAAAVAYGAYRVVNWAWDSWSGQSSDNDDPLVRREVLVSQTPQNQRQRWRLRRQRVERCREEAVNALSDFLPTLRRNIEELTDTSEDTKDLKQLRSSTDEDRRDKERDLWNVIKTKALTRLIATAYAHTILFLVLTVQVHLMGGKLFEEQAHESETSSSVGGSLASGRMASYHESHRIVLTRTYAFFFDQGIKLLVAATERAVETVVGDWDVTHPSSVHTSREVLDKAIQEICQSLEGRTLGRSPARRPRSILRFLLPSEQGLESVVADELAQSILDETLDILESPVFEDAQHDALATTLGLMRDKSWSNIFLETNLPQHASSPWGTKPLATVVSKLKMTSSTFFAAPPQIEETVVFHESRTAVNLYLSTVERIPSVLELGDVSFN
jgi:peroxin-3